MYKVGLGASQGIGVLRCGAHRRNLAQLLELGRQMGLFDHGDVVLCRASISLLMRLLKI